MPRLIAVNEKKKLHKKWAKKKRHRKREGERERKMACHLEKVSFAIEIKRMSLPEVISAHSKKGKREGELRKCLISHDHKLILNQKRKRVASSATHNARMHALAWTCRQCDQMEIANCNAKKPSPTKISIVNNSKQDR